MYIDRDGKNLLRVKSLITEAVELDHNTRYTCYCYVMNRFL